MEVEVVVRPAVVNIALRSVRSVNVEVLIRIRKDARSASCDMIRVVSAAGPRLSEAWKSKLRYLEHRRQSKAIGTT